MVCGAACVEGLGPLLTGGNGEERGVHSRFAGAAWPQLVPAGARRAPSPSTRRSPPPAPLATLTDTQTHAPQEHTPFSNAHSLYLPLHPTAGSNSANQLGVDSADVATSLTPIAIADPSLAFVSLAAADTVSCGTLINASVACWGGYTDASQSELLPPQPRIVGADQIASLAARGSSMCGVTLQGQAGCAGEAPPRQQCLKQLAPAAPARRGWLGDRPSGQGGGMLDSGRRAAVAAVCTLVHHGHTLCCAALCCAGCVDLTCARPLCPAGVVGSYIDAQGYPETVFSEQPTPVPSPASFTTITVGGSGFYFHACGLTLEGAALCWGAPAAAHAAAAAASHAARRCEAATPSRAELPQRPAAAAMHTPDRARVLLLLRRAEQRGAAGGTAV